MLRGVSTVLALIIASAVTIGVLQSRAPRDVVASDRLVSGGTQYGASFQLRAGESYADGLQRTDTRVGPLDLVRIYYSGGPGAWPGKAPGRSAIVSFKLPPSEVVAGDHDDLMRRWFSEAPRDLDVYWVYWHEPEDDIENGAFTASQFRKAFEHLAELSRSVDKPRLRSTLVLMSYTLAEQSGRAWRDYWPGGAAIDVFAWDVYERADASCAYCSPETMFDGPREVAASVGKPFGVAELGSELEPGDDGSGRAEWVQDVGEYMRRHDALFVAWFNFRWDERDADYRLRDKPSVAAWRQLTRS